MTASLSAASIQQPDRSSTRATLAEKADVLRRKTRLLVAATPPDPLEVATRKKLLADNLCLPI